MFEFVVEFLLEVFLGSLDEITKKHKKITRRILIAIFSVSLFAFLVAVPVLGETNGKSVLGLILISILPVVSIAMVISYIIFKLKK